MKFPRALASIRDAGFIEAAIAREFIVTGYSSALGGGGAQALSTSRVREREAQQAAFEDAR